MRTIKIIKKLLLTVCLVIVSILFTACPDIEGEYLKIINNSDENILWITTSDHPYDNTHDLNEMKYNPWTTTHDGKVVNSMEDAKKRNAYIAAGDTLVDFIPKFPEFTRITYWLFIYDSVCNIPWQRIRDEEIYLKKVTFNSWEEMEACNFTITYP